jgi:hypothetical protein
MKPIAVIGQGNAGKTSLIRRLTGSGFKKGSAMTPNVTLTRDKANGIVYIDCGGQIQHFIPSIEPIRKIHPLFLVTRTINREQINIDDARSQWLVMKKIVDPTNRSNVIAVDTHCNTARGGYCDPGKSPEPENGVDVFYVDSSSNDGIDELRDEVLKLATDLPNQEITEKDFYFCNLAMRIINQASSQGRSKEELVKVSRNEFVGILSKLGIKEEVDNLISELEKLNVLIKHGDDIIFPINQPYHLYETSKKKLDPAMKIKTFHEGYSIPFLAIKLGKYVTDVDPSVICLSSDPVNNPKEVIIKSDFGSKNLTIAGQKGSEFLTLVQKGILDFLKSNNLEGIEEVHLACPCEECSKTGITPSWLSYKILSGGHKLRCDNSYEFIQGSDLPIFKITY